ncbi:PepSY-associated TM helix domain-containing protein [Pelosinus sp. sgz500959]|uniref:PepSY-associated TM helix domain-containing protein n=1 Tax=Pelosinus sp. sgz500959 TaxID=3242472 RepID=UPI00366C7460
MIKSTINKTVTQSMSELHTWGGLIFGWLLFVIFLTGTLAVFQPELTHWMKPEFRAVQVMPEQALAEANKKLRQVAPQSDNWTIRLPQTRYPVLDISWKKGKATLERHLDPLTGEIIKERQTEGGHFFTDFHSELHRGKAGLWLVSAASLVLLAAVVSGIIIRKQVFKEFFLLRWRRTWLHAHLMTGVLTLPFVLLITYTGLVLTFMEVMPVATHLLYENKAKLWSEVGLISDQKRGNVPATLLPLEQLLPLAEKEFGKGKIAYVLVKNPGDQQAVITFIRNIDDRIAAVGDRVSFNGVTGELIGIHKEWNPSVYTVRYLAGLHVARFGGYMISWLYFLSGLIGCVMIAAGLVFFTVKRRSRYAKSSKMLQHTYRAIEALNTTAITGAMIACTSYLWANRLLPISMRERADSEITVFFCVWLLMLIHAFWRSPLRAWIEQLAIAAGLCIGLPIINSLTTNVGLLRAIPRSDWMTVGVDLTAIVFGILLGTVAWRIANKENDNSHRVLN